MRCDAMRYDALREALLAPSVLHADPTPAPVQMRAPGKRKTPRVYVCADARAVVDDFAQSRGGEYARRFLAHRQGKRVCDDFSGYQEGCQQGLTEVGGRAHARRKFVDLHAQHNSELASAAVCRCAL